jgi:hypothetical protein
VPEISLTDFVDFVVKVGSPKLTKVREIKNRGEYSPAIDAWKRLREGIIGFHRDSTPLDITLSGITDRKKLRRYPAAIAGYRRFARRNDSAWFEPPVKKWIQAGLEVRVNPELGLRINGCDTIIKLYFRDEALTKSRLAVVFEAHARSFSPPLRLSNSSHYGCCEWKAYPIRSTIESWSSSDWRSDVVRNDMEFHLIVPRT